MQVRGRTKSSEQRRKASPNIRAQTSPAHHVSTPPSPRISISPIEAPAPSHSPEIPELMPTFSENIASHILRQKERKSFRCINHATKLKQWVLAPFLNQYVEHSGLMPLVQCSYTFTDKSLVSTFLERWQPGTCTFHMPFGEMTITLDDVSCLTGLPVIGLSVSLRGQEKDDIIDVVCRALGVTVEDAIVGLGKPTGSALALEWLRSRFSSVSSTSGEDAQRAAARAYLLYLLGCTIFADKTGFSVSAHYLRLLEDLDRVHTYAWGSAALCYLYRQLSLGSKITTAQICGYLTLLESWIYEHFPDWGPTMRSEAVQGPLATRWEVSKPTLASDDRIRDLRARIDLMRSDQVIWQPYKEFRATHPEPQSIWFKGMLRCMEYLEPYHPDRVLRQFGRQQFIPRRPFLSPAIKRVHKVSSTAFAPFTDDLWEDWENHCIQQRGDLILPGVPDCVPEYMEWYKARSLLRLSSIDRLNHRPQPPSGPSLSPLLTTYDREHVLSMMRPVLSTQFDFTLPGIDELYAVINGIRIYLEDPTLTGSLAPSSTCPSASSSPASRPSTTVYQRKKKKTAK